MNSQKRHKNKKRMINLFRIGWFGGLLIILIGIVLKLSLDTTEKSLNLLFGGILLSGGIFAFLFHVFGTDISLKLRREKGRLLYEKYKLHLNRFYDSINNKELDKSLYIFNTFLSIDVSKSIDVSSSYIAQGVLLGVIKENYDIVSDSIKNMVEKRLELLNKC
jgi:hypothetical protein